MVECEMPLVLVHNDVVANPAHAWNDVEGVHYHYPSKYQGKIKTGEPFDTEAVMRQGIINYHKSRE